ncbi:MAG: DUF3592 domain-containing protein [Chloroflexia bacterium]
MRSIQLPLGRPTSCGGLLVKGLLLPGLLALGGAFVPSMAQRYLNSALTASAPAQVIEVKTNTLNNKNNTYCRTTVRFRYAINGEEREGSDCIHFDRLNADWGMSGDWTRKFPERQPVVVCYDPANTKRAIVVPGDYACPPGATPWRRWWEGAGAGLLD